MKSTLKIALVAALAVGGLGLGASGAKAEIVCNADNECWHVHHAYNYQPGYGVVVHRDDWRWGASDHYAWHEHHGGDRGYWHSGVWIGF